MTTMEFVAKITKTAYVHEAIRSVISTVVAESTVQYAGQDVSANKVSFLVISPKVICTFKGNVGMINALASGLGGSAIPLFALPAIVVQWPISPIDPWSRCRPSSNL